MSAGTAGYRFKSTYILGKLLKESQSAYAKRIDTILGELESMSARHVTWYTHKNDGTNSCWICETLRLARFLHGELASMDEGTDSSSEEQTESDGVPDVEETVEAEDLLESAE